MRAMAASLRRRPRRVGPGRAAARLRLRALPQPSPLADRGAPGRRGAASWPPRASPSTCSAPSSATRTTAACPATPRWPRPSSRWMSCADSWWPARWSGPRRASWTSRSSSVKKKLKDKAFARGVSREDVLQGAAELGVAAGGAHRVRARRPPPGRTRPRTRDRMTHPAERATRLSTTTRTEVQRAIDRAAAARPIPGNRVALLQDGPEAYAAMLALIAGRPAVHPLRELHLPRRTRPAGASPRRWPSGPARVSPSGCSTTGSDASAPAGSTGVSCAQPGVRCAASIRRACSGRSGCSRAIIASWWWPTAAKRSWAGCASETNGPATR